MDDWKATMNQGLRVLGLCSVIALASGCAKQAALQPVSMVPPTPAHAVSHVLGPIQRGDACPKKNAIGCNNAARVNVYYLVRN